MLQNILNLEGVQVLNRNQQKEVLGGQAQYDKCRLYINTPNGGGYWSEYVSFAQASSEWDGTEYSDGSYASGYCCASC